MSWLSTECKPSLGEAPVSEATILSVAAGTATEQELARVAIAVDDAGQRIDGIVVADPDQTDRTSGRHTMDERSRRPALPMRLTGIASADGAAEPPAEEPLMTQAGTGLLDLDEVDEASQERSSPTLVSLHFIRSALRRRWLVCVLCAVTGVAPGRRLSGCISSVAHREGSTGTGT